MRFRATAELHGRNDGCRGRVAGLSGGRKAVRARRELAAASRCGRCAAGERQTWRWGERTMRRFPGPGSSFTDRFSQDRSNGRSAIGIDSFDCKSLRTLFQFLPYVFCEDSTENFGKFYGDTRTRGHVRSGQHGRRMGPVAVCCCPPPSRDARERARPARPADCRRATTSDTAVGT